MEELNCTSKMVLSLPSTMLEHDSLYMSFYGQLYIYIYIHICVSATQQILL